MLNCIVDLKVNYFMVFKNTTKCFFCEVSENKSKRVEAPQMLPVCYNVII